MTRARTRADSENSATSTTFTGLRRLAEDRDATMADTLDAALESLRRERFYEGMATAEQELRNDADAWDTYVRERDAWLNPDLAAS